MGKFLDQTGIKYLWGRIVDTINNSINNSISPGGGGKFPKVRIVTWNDSWTPDSNVVSSYIHIENYKSYIDAGYIPVFFICSSKHISHQRYTYCKAKSTISEYGNNSISNQREYFKFTNYYTSPSIRTRTLRKDWRMYNNILCKIDDLGNSGVLYIYWPYNYVKLLHPDRNNRPKSYKITYTQDLAKALVPTRMYKDIIPYAIYGYPRSACGAKRNGSISPANHVWCIDPWLLQSNWSFEDIKFFSNKSDQELHDIMMHRSRNLCFEFKFGFVPNSLYYRIYGAPEHNIKHDPLYSSKNDYYYFLGGYKDSDMKYDKPSMYFFEKNLTNYTLSDVVSNIITFKVYINTRFKRKENPTPYTPKYSLIIEQ